MGPAVRSLVEREIKRSLAVLSDLGGRRAGRRSRPNGRRRTVRGFSGATPPDRARCRGSGRKARGFAVFGVVGSSGVVFGNGMRQSLRIRLLAAFNHLHIFVDPSPDAAKSQAERERQFRVILGEAEMQVAGSFAEASKAYVDNPTALHLRAMNMLFEGLKEKGALVIVPSSAVDTMNLGGLSGMVSLAQSNVRKKE